MQLDRKRAAELGRETVEILKVGHYPIEGMHVEIADLIDEAVRGTQLYPPGVPDPGISPGKRPSRIKVENTTTLSAAQGLTEQGRRVAALNFASANNPGGGFLGGSRAQEESLARSSGLCACLKDQAMYAYHRQQRDPMYSNYAIYSPDVPVFRTDAGDLLPIPYLCSFITCPAVNARVVLERDRKAHAKIREAMEARIKKVLAIAAHHKHDALVLGAWGCGVFGNDSQQIASLFDDALSHYASGVFDIVIFAITDWSKNQRFIGSFQKQFLKDKR